MVERLGHQHHEAAQAQQPFDSAIARFCVGFKNPNTRAAYESDLRDFSSFAKGHDVGGLDQLSLQDIEIYFKGCEVSGLSRATRKRRLASLSGLLAQEGMEELARKTWDIGIKHVGSTEEVQPFHPLSSEEVKKLQEESRNNPRASAIIAIALGTGANLEEIRALNVNDIIEKESNQVAVAFSGRRSKREIILDIDSSAIVRRYKGDCGGENPLFAQKLSIRPGGERLSRGSISSDVKQYAEKIKRPDLSLRVLRQTFIVNVSKNDSEELDRLLGIGEPYARALLKRRSLTQQLPQSGVLFEAATTH